MYCGRVASYVLCKISICLYNLWFVYIHWFLTLRKGEEGKGSTLRIGSFDGEAKLSYLKKYKLYYFGKMIVI